MRSIFKLNSSFPLFRWPWASPQLSPSVASAASQSVAGSVATPQMNPSGAPAQENYGWILHPGIDLMFVCGGFVWLFALLVAVVPGFNSMDTQACKTFALYTYLIFAVPHGMASYLRVYDVKATRKASGIKVALLAGVALALVIIGCLSTFWASVVGRLALCFSFQHGLAQAYGISLLYCYKRKFYLTKWEKRIFFLVIQATLLLGVTNVLGDSTMTFADKKLDNLIPEFPKWVQQTCECAAVLAVLAFTTLMGRKYVVEKRLMPLPAILTIATGIFIYGFLLNKVPQMRTSGLIVLYYLAHGLFHTPQYLAVTTSVALKNRDWPESLPYSKIASRLFSLTALKHFITLYCLAWTFMLLAPSLQIAMNNMGLIHHPELWALVWVSGMNLHHYWTDAIIWKLKDKDNLKLLIS